MRFAALIGEGPNDVTIPALIFSTLEKGLDECIKLFGNEYTTDHNDGQVSYRWMLPQENNNDIDGETADKLFTDYYGGCGDCYAVTLKEIEEGKPFVGWNLD